MKIVLQDKDNGNQFMIAGNGTEFEIFKYVEAGTMKNGKDREAGWVTLKQYAQTLGYAIYLAVRALLVAKDPDESEAKLSLANDDINSIRKDLNKILQNKLKKMQMEVVDD